jgi:rfaE bifunctional protein nucleotidyltransferase chain/domain
MDTVHSDKILSLDVLKKKLASREYSGRQIVFTNGCFDILHAGHVRYLSAARAEGDVLVVGLNSDVSVKAIKGSNRPIVSEAYRAEVLAGLTCVDHIILFDEPDPYRLIQALMPNVLVKGADWAEDEIIGSDIVKNNGGRVVRVALLPDVSTSKIIERIIAAYG